MAKLSRLQRSQNAHSRLRMKHADTPGKKGEIKYTYHNKILAKQKALGRVMTRSERKMEYDSISSFFNKKKTTYAQVSNEHYKYGRYK